MFLHKTEGNYLLPNKYFNYCEHNQFKSIKLEKRVEHKIEYRYLFFLRNTVRNQHQHFLF